MCCCRRQINIPSPHDTAARKSVLLHQLISWCNILALSHNILYCVLCLCIGRQECWLCLHSQQTSYGQQRQYLNHLLNTCLDHFIVETCLDFVGTLHRIPGAFCLIVRLPHLVVETCCVFHDHVLIWMSSLEALTWLLTDIFD